MVGCARCDGDGHEDVLFKPLTHPVQIEGWWFGFWAPCPANGEPILMGVSPKSEDDTL
jgi:hypothetical protein